MNALYDRARELFLTAQIDWVGQNFVAWLVSDGYVFDAGHETLANIPASARLRMAPEQLSGKTATGGVASAATIIFPNVLGEGLAKAVVFIRASDDLLVWYGAKAFGLPFRPDGREAVLRRDDVFGGFFRL